MASDRYDEQARRIIGVVLYNEDREQQVATAIRTAAQEAQGRVLDEYRALMRRHPACQRVNDASMIAAAGALDELRARIKKEGPL